MKKFKKAYIEITNICNLNCHFCPETSRKPGYMRKAEFMHIINEVRPYTDHIYFHLMGEPLLNPELERFLEICHESNLKVNITTNGTLLKRVKNVLLGAPALRKVSISLHSYEANEAGTGLIEYITNVIDFVKEASNKSIICELRLWNKDSENIKASNELNNEIISLIENQLQLETDLKTALRQSNNVKLKNYIFLQMADKFEWPDIDRDIVSEDMFCYGLRDQFGVLVDGTVVPCCLDSEGSIALGNLYKQPLKDILNSDRARNMYNGFTARKAVEELCKKCGYATRHRRS